MIQEIKATMSSECQNPLQQKITKTPRMEVIKQLIDSLKAKTSHRQECTSCA